MNIQYESKAKANTTITTIHFEQKLYNSFNLNKWQTEKHK